MVDINIGCEEEDNRYICDVSVNEENSRSEHTVYVDKNDFEGFESFENVESLVRESFYFLLDRESKESILSSFNLMKINDYFPSFTDEISN